MPKIIDLTGQTFGRLTVLRQDGILKKKKAWRCACECGAEHTVIGLYLLQGDTRSCGCLQRDHWKTTSVTHGHTVGGVSTPTRNSWRAMLERCRLPSHPQYKNYGGRGVSVCARWADNFGAFLADMGERPEGMTLDRVDPYGNYEPGNCRWASRSEQARNKRRKENKNLPIKAQHPSPTTATARGQTA